MTQMARARDESDVPNNRSAKVSDSAALKSSVFRSGLLTHVDHACTNASRCFVALKYGAESYFE